MAPNEAHPYRAAKSKRFITKVMFEVAVARPEFSDDGTCIFGGKIGVFLLTQIVATQRSSIHRQAGTLKTKPIKNITQEVIRRKFIDELLPTLKAKWSLHRSSTIWIQ